MLYLAQTSLKIHGKQNMRTISLDCRIITSTFLLIAMKSLLHQITLEFPRNALIMIKMVIHQSPDAGKLTVTTTIEIYIQMLQKGAMGMMIIAIMPLMKIQMPYAAAKISAFQAAANGKHA